MKSRRESTLIPIRFIVLLLALMMAALLYLTRVNLSVTIVAMAKQTNNTNDRNSKEDCPKDDSSEKNSTKSSQSSGGKFDWNQTEQGIILSAFYYGYILLQVIGGRLAEMWGAKWLCASGILLSGIINLLTPVIADWNLIALIISRVILGMAQSVDFPAGYLLLTKWFPERELGTALGLFTAGSNIGAITTMGMSGYLSSSSFLGGWPSVFYTSGFLACVWFVFWALLVKSDPKDHNFISQKEFEYIENNRANKSDDNKKAKRKAPWLQILTSKQVISVIIVKFGGAWNFLLVMSKVPAYLQLVLHYPIAQNGYMMALIYLSVFISISSGGFLSDLIINRKIIKDKTLVRKIFQVIAIGGSSATLALIPLATCHRTVVIVLFMVSMFSYGMVSGGDIPIVPDMTTNFPGTVIAIANSIATIAGITGPLVVGLIIKDDDQSRVLWSYVFYLSAILNFVALSIFLIWGSAEVQDWDYVEDNDSKKEEKYTPTYSPKIDFKFQL